MLSFLEQDLKKAKTNVNGSRAFIKGESCVPVQSFDMSKRSITVSASATETDLGGQYMHGRKLQYPWLRSASPVYAVSHDIRDFVIVAVPIVTSDIPNLNCQAFNASDLFQFDRDSGHMRYNTFTAQPTFQDHVNGIAVNAKGVIFDTTIIHVPKYNVFKVVALCGFDRSKDASLANDILSGKRNGYSMGARAYYFQCSICGGVLGPQITRTCTCQGSDYRDLASLGHVVHGKVHYHMAKFFNYIEISSVGSPADFTAVTDNLL